jgi:hypothetical protein
MKELVLASKKTLKARKRLLQGYEMTMTGGRIT